MVTSSSNISVHGIKQNLAGSFARIVHCSVVEWKKDIHCRSGGESISLVYGVGLAFWRWSLNMDGRQRRLVEKLWSHVQNEISNALPVS